MNDCTLAFIRNTDTGEWYWNFVAGNSEELSRSSETYKSREAANVAARLTFGIPLDMALDDGAYLNRSAAVGLPGIRIRVYS